MLDDALARQVICVVPECQPHLAFSYLAVSKRGKPEKVAAPKHDEGCGRDHCERSSSTQRPEQRGGDAELARVKAEQEEQEDEKDGGDENAAVLGGYQQTGYGAGGDEVNEGADERKHAAGNGGF